VTFVRPFLEVSRSEMRGYLQAKGVAWVDDPSNENPRFGRTHAREALRALQPLGVTTGKIITTMANLRESQAALREAVAVACKACLVEQAGAVAIDAGVFAGFAGDVRHRLLVALVQWLSGEAHPPRAEGIMRLQAAILRGGSATLGGCRLNKGWLFREAKAVAGAQMTTALWDNRWRITGPHADGFTIRALGDGLRECVEWRTTGIPRDALLVTPAIWRGDTLVAAPFAGLANGWTAEITQSLHAFILSH
jgi:tRNA(Ile)-lysidine synthase